MAQGGARPGSGRKKGSTNLITIDALRKAFEDKLTIPFEEMLANMQLKFYQDFQNNENVDAAARFTINMATRMIQPMPQQVETTVNVSDLSPDEVNARLASILSLKTTEQISPNSGEISDQE